MAACAVVLAEGKMALGRPESAAKILYHCGWSKAARIAWFIAHGCSAVQAARLVGPDALKVLP